MILITGKDIPEQCENESVLHLKQIVYDLARKSFGLELTADEMGTVHRTKYGGIIAYFLQRGPQSNFHQLLMLTERKEGAPRVFFNLQVKVLHFNCILNV